MAFRDREELLDRYSRQGPTLRDDPRRQGAGSGADADMLDGLEGSHYLDRANHTGSQTSGTISDFNAAVTALVNSIYTAADVLSKLLTVDGAGSGLDADLLDGQQGVHYLDRANHTGSQAQATITNLVADLAAKLDAASYTAADVLAKVKTVDGSGSGLDADLLRGTTPSAFGLTIIDDADAATVRTTIGLVIGTHVQAFHANLSAFAGLGLVADRLPYADGAGTLALATLTTAGRALIDDADAAAQRTTLGLGTIATQDASGLTGVTLAGGGNAISGGISLSTAGYFKAASSLGLLLNNNADTANLFQISNAGAVHIHQGLGNFADDAAAAAGGVAVNQFYRNGSAVMIRVA